MKTTTHHPIPRRHALHAVTACTLLALLAAGCAESPRGGGGFSDDWFVLRAPAMPVTVIQGQGHTVAIEIVRGERFKRDLTLELKAVPDGLKIEPQSIAVKAGDRPEVRFVVQVPADAPLGDFSVYVRGVPDQGEPTTVEFTVHVVAP